MKASCPACGMHGDLGVFVTDVESREFDALLAQLIPDGFGRLVLQYLSLFNPAQRALSWSRGVRLLGEIVPMVIAAQIERHGRTWPAPRDAWIAAIGEMLSRRDKLQLPLTSHAYLLEIIAARQDKAEAAVEKRVESQRRVESGARAAAARSLGEIVDGAPQATSEPASPRARAVAALAIEIKRRRDDSEPEMTVRESQQFLKLRERDYAGCGGSREEPQRTDERNGHD